MQLHFGHQLVSLPCHSKQLRLTFHKDGDVRQAQASFEVSRLQSLVQHNESNVEYPSPSLDAPRHCGCAHDVLDMNIDGDKCDRVFGIRWTEEQFVQQALVVGHPFDSFSVVSAEIRHACSFVAGNPDGVVADSRAKELQHWLRKVKELSPQDREMKAKLPSDMRAILQPKRLAFMQWVIDEYSYDSAFRYPQWFFSCVLLDAYQRSLCRRFLQLRA